MLVSTIVLASLIASGETTPLSVGKCPKLPTAGPVTTIATFPQGNWVENLALRSDNTILTTLFEPGKVVLVSPDANLAQRQKVVHVFEKPNTAVLGIVEPEQDVFYLATMLRGASLLDSVPGSGQIRRLDLRKFNHNKIPATLVANITDSLFLNGATLVPGTHDMLIADSQQGVVFHVNLDNTRGEYNVVANNSALKPTKELNLGVNGIHARNKHLYFTNSAQGVYARFSIDQSGSQIGRVEVLNRNRTWLLDDFDFDDDWTNSPATIAALGRENEVIWIPGGGSACATKSLATIEGATALKVQFSKSHQGVSTVFVTSAGNESAYEVSGPVHARGALSAFQIYH